MTVKDELHELVDQRHTERPRPQPSAAKHVPSPETLAVWEAEDGRCEGCHRPMDRSIGLARRPVEARSE